MPHNQDFDDFAKKVAAIIVLEKNEHDVPFSECGPVIMDALKLSPEFLGLLAREIPAGGRQEGFAVSMFCMGYRMALQLGAPPPAAKAVD